MKLCRQDQSQRSNRHASTLVPKTDFPRSKSKALYVDELRPVSADLSKLNSQKDCV